MPGWNRKGNKKSGDSFICINPSCTVQETPVSFKESTTIDCECGWNLGWKSQKEELYFLKHFHGEGGGGSVYEAWKRTPNGFEGKYALKFLHPVGGVNFKQCKEKLEREAQALQKAYDTGARVPRYIDRHSPESEQDPNNHFFFIQEFIEGDNLENILKYKKKKITEGNDYFNEKELFQYLIDLLETLHLLHQQGILHRDIKPRNIIQKSIMNNVQRDSAENKHLYLVDFGSSKQLEPGIDNKYTRNHPRTSAYTPPETLIETELSTQQLEQYKLFMGEFRIEQEPLDKYSWTRDIYSLGITIFELLDCISKGNSPVIPRWQPSDKAWSEWMSNIRQKIPDLYPILEKMTRFYPDERYQTAMDTLLEANAQAWYIYGDRGDNCWLLKEKFLKDALKSIDEKGINLPLLQEQFLQKSKEQQDREDYRKIFREN
ncbi:MAG: protein kinase [Symploca sp. SIO1A3]|nr:protein kinase [Symploca sp. SIO1A3]